MFEMLLSIRLDAYIIQSLRLSWVGLKYSVILLGWTNRGPKERKLSNLKISGWS